MSDVSQGPGWWQASDGKWYPPKDADKAPAPGWWLASDGKWYPPLESEKAPAPGWWLAADGKWYPPEKKTAAATATPPAATPAAAETTKPAPAKPVAAKPAAAKPVAAKPATPPSAPAPAPAPAKPAAAAAKPAAPAAKPAAAKPAPAKPAAAAAAPASAAAEQVVRPAFGLSPQEQIRIQNEQSRRDAAVLSGARRLAATRALGNLKDLIEEEKAAQGRDLRESPAMRAAGGAPAAAPPPPAPPAPPAAAKAPAAKTAKATTPKTSAKTPAAKGADTKAPAAAEAPAASNEPPLLEVKQGTLAADVEHLGERLAIFNDRVELQDRSNRVRQVIYGRDIADVVVHKKFTGSTVTVESGSGESIVAKGLKPDQADEIRALILKRTRQGVAAGSPAAPATAPAPTTAPASTAPPAAKPAATAPPAAKAKPSGAESAASRPAVGKQRLNEDDLITKLTDLHRAGVLTDDELEEKKALVGRLARGETLAASSTP